MSLIREITRTNDKTAEIFLFEDLAHTILSDKDYKRLEAHVKTESGRIPVDAMYKEFTQIFTYLKSAKN